MYLSFDGTAYSGWQSQPDAPSVQETIEKALSLFLRENVCITGAGRTDAGVHARLMVAHFDLQQAQDTAWMVSKLNAILPRDISVNRIVRVKADAHARFDAVQRTYRYYVTLSKNPFCSAFSCRLYSEPDFALMNRAATMLTEASDFTSFSKLHTDTKTNICRVTEACWTQTGPDSWMFTISADRFLRNMVRAVVGTLLEVGRHKMTLDEFRSVIDGCDRCLAGDSAPACGLFLEDVVYPESIFDYTE